MKKLYYKIKLRIGSTYLDHKGNLQRDFYYYSDVYIIITGEKFEGYLTDDYIKGYLTETDITLKLQRKEQTETFVNSSDEIFEISEGIESDVLISNEEDYEFCYIYFVKKINDSKMKQKIEKNIKIVKESHIKPKVKDVQVLHIFYILLSFIPIQ